MMNPELEEKDFIRELKSVKGWRIWLSLGLAAFCFVFFMFAAASVVFFTASKVEKEPFLQVTNREFSLFLWQNPEFMRSNRRKKAGYLSGFYPYPKATPRPEQADDWVSAPPDILFLYHAWERLLNRERFARVVSAAEFRKFLDEAKEWQPQFWEGGPYDYSLLVESLPLLGQEDIQARLPDPVMRAFIGWKNYFEEGGRINQEVYTAGELEVFIKQHPFYAVSYWKQVYGGYLRSLDGGKRDAVVPFDEIPSFLKVALYNHRRERI